MEKLENRQQVDEYFSGDKIQCLICGKWFKSLGSHVIRIHNMGINEYKTMFNIPWTRGLVSDVTKQKQSVALKSRIESCDKSLMPINKVAHMGQHAKRRQKRDYEYERVRCLQAKITDLHRKKTRKKAMEILKTAENLNCPACCVCMLPGVPGLHNLMAAIKRDRALKERYENLKNRIPRGIEITTEQHRNAVKQQIQSLRENGLTTRQIAKELFIGVTTVKRALRNEGAFADC
jgi:hypothetical protein